VPIERSTATETPFRRTHEFFIMFLNSFEGILGGISKSQATPNCILY
jgi:hypothetical protein